MSSIHAVSLGHDGSVGEGPIEGDAGVRTDLPAYSAAFDAFYRATYGRVVAVAHSMTGDRHLGEEIAQEAFIAAHRNWGKVSTLDRPDLWVRRVAVNRCTSTFRRKLIEWRSNRTVHGGQLSVVPGPTGEEAEARTAIWDAVRTLPDRQRTIVVLHYVDGLTTPEIGELLELTPSTVQTHLGRARQRLADLLAPLTEGDQP
jgi:RNA polymerase sigma-70 factor (ECF subfamily)